MDIDLYAQLHGLTRGMRSQKNKTPPESATEDPQFEVALAEYIEVVVEDEKNGFQESLESFSTHANKVRYETRKVLHDFYKNYRSGIEALSEIVKSQGGIIPLIDQERLQLCSDAAYFVKAMQQGKSIYQLLGLTGDTLAILYKAAHELILKKDFEKARNAFFFLVTISVHNSHFWLGLGASNAALQEYPESIHCFEQAIEISPKKEDGYLGCIHSFLKLGKIEEAVAICDKGLLFASNEKELAWAQNLADTLAEAKKQILDTK